MAGIARKLVASRRVRGLLLGALGLTVCAWLGLKLVPMPTALQGPPPQSLQFVDRHGKVLRETRTGEQFARPVKFAELPPRLVHAFLAAEDKRFFDHGGVDLLAVLRAARDGVVHSRIVSGASTITQQLVKVAEPRPRTFRTKVIEAIKAIRLEQLWTKERILEEYVNRIDFGHMNVGIRSAADFYFGKPLGDLTDAESAFLAGLPKNPRRLNPHRSFTAAEKRTRTVLRRMFDNGWLTREAYDLALAEPAKVRPPAREFVAPHFVDLALKQPGATAGIVRTTIDHDLNRFVEGKLRDQLAPLKERRVTNGAVVVIENSTGAVLALVGSGDYFSSSAGQVNGAWSPRSAGSTVKPFTYLLALQGGATAATIYPDVPTEFSTPTGTIRIDNYNRRCAGPVTLRSALACSLNIPAVRALESVGGPAVLQRFLTKFGFTTLNRTPAEFGLGLTIGNAEVRLVELTNAYAALARLGEYRPWRIFEEQPIIAGRQVADSRACWLLADILSDNAARIPGFGSESPLRFSFPVACKTGTSTDYRDNWAMAYTPEFTVGVWVGNFDGSAMRGVSGVSGAAPLMHVIVEHLRSTYGTSWYAEPPNVTQAEVHPLTGRIITRGWPTGIREKFVAENTPAEEGPNDYDDDGRIRLPAIYAEWLASPECAISNQAVADEQLRIVSPVPGTTFVIDPDLPSSARARLVAGGAPSVEWSSDTLEFSARGTTADLPLKEGEHRVKATDPVSGVQAETWIRVKAL